MSLFANPLIGIGLGALFSFLISRYYYKRNFNSSLTPYIQFSSSPLIGVDPKLRNDLKVNYRNKEVENLLEIQFLIANTGDKPIKAPLKPLTLSIPESNEILDSKILYINPEGREVNISENPTRTSIIYDFSLLNSGDFFISKLLINGNPSLEDFKFEIGAEELPPSLAIKDLPTDALNVKGKKKFRFDGMILLLGLGLLFFGCSVLKLIFVNIGSFPSIIDLGFTNFIKIMGTTDIAVMISILPTLILIVLGIMLVFGSFTDFSFPKPKNRFNIPEEKDLLRKAYFHRNDFFN